MFGSMLETKPSNYALNCGDDAGKGVGDRNWQLFPISPRYMNDLFSDAAEVVWETLVVSGLLLRMKRDFRRRKNIFNAVYICYTRSKMGMGRWKKIGVAQIYVYKTFCA